MGLEIKTLPLVQIGASLPCIRPQLNKNPVTKDHPAVEVMTDFAVVTPVTIEAWSGLYLALEKMKTMGVRLLLVADEDDNIDGVVTSYDLQSEKPVRYAENTGINHREINIGMIKTPIAETPAVDLDFVRQSLVRHVVNTLKQLDRPHILVIETLKNNRQQIRGLFSTSHISKVLGEKIHEPLKAFHSLAEMKQLFD